MNEDPDGFARLHRLADSGPASSRKDAQIAATRVATLPACKDGLIRDITVGDCVELVDAQRRVHARGGRKKIDFYLRLRTLGIFPEDAPATIRAFGLALGQLSIEELVDRYRIQCRPVRDLIVDYLRERQPSLDFASLDAVSRTLAGLFWARIEALAPGSTRCGCRQQWPALGRRISRSRSVRSPVPAGGASRSPARGSKPRTSSSGSGPSTSTSRSGRPRNQPAGVHGPCPVRSAMTRSTKRRTASTARPGCTSAHASDCLSCPR
jgi:hypothetical protein